MEKRRFGRTSHLSTAAVFGAFAFSEVSQEEADGGMELLFQHGVNHIDVAPSYGEAELRLGPWMERDGVRERFFLGCKTMEREESGAMTELHRSLERLRTDHFDLYQIHAVTKMEELDAATRTGGALDAMQKAREQGLTRFIGITGHGLESPAVFIEALNRFDFDSVLFPINFILFANPAYRENALELLRMCRDRDVGTMVIKSVSKGAWDDPKNHPLNTWYEPFTDRERIQQAVNFALSQDVTAICTAGDLTLLPTILQAVENYRPLSPREQEALIATASEFDPLFTY